MSFQTLRCTLCTSEAVRQKIWSWTEKYTLLVNELLNRVATHEKFEEWQVEGSISRKEIEKLLQPLKISGTYEDLPGRFYTSATLMVHYTYLSWLALQKKRHFKMLGKQRWLEVLEADLELSSVTDFDWSTIRDRASEILTQILNLPDSESAKITDQQPSKDKKTTPFNILFTLISTEKDLLSQRAIAYLIRNNLKVEEQEESLDELLFRFERKRIEIERLAKQMESRKPKGRDPLGTRFQESFELAITLPKHTSSKEVEPEFNSWKSQKQIQIFNSLHYPIIFGGDDLTWLIEGGEHTQKLSKNETQSVKKRRPKKKCKQSFDRICVNFKGFKKFLGEVSGSFKIQCDRRQLPIFRQIVNDWQAYKQSSDDEKYSLGLMPLRSAQLIWKEDKHQLHKKKFKKQRLSDTTALSDQFKPWQTHRLCLHICIDPTLLTAEGVEAVRQRKTAITNKKLDSLKKKNFEFEELFDASKTVEIHEADKMTAQTQRKIENKITSTTTSLTRLQRPGPLRLSKPGYQGQPNVILGVSLSRDQPVGVAVVDVQTGAIIEYQNTRLLLSNRTIKAKLSKRSVVQLRLEKYRLVNRRRRQHQQNIARRSKEQRQNRYTQSKSESKLGQYADRLIASRIVKLATKWKASSIVVPNLGDIRESVEADQKAKANHRFPNEIERQKKYAKNIRSSYHTWSYGHLIDCIKGCASRIGIPIERGQQPVQGSLQEKALQVALHAYYTR